MDKVVCLCGSTRFKDKFMEWNRYFTLQNFIVVMPGVFAHAGDAITDEQKVALDSLHKRKILMSDFIFVIDQDGYIGDSTKSEIKFAQEKGIEVYYMSDVEIEKKENN